MTRKEGFLNPAAVHQRDSCAGILSWFKRPNDHNGKETGVRIVPVIMTGTMRELGIGIETGTESGKETEIGIGGMNMIEDPEMAMEGIMIGANMEVHHREKGSSRHSWSRSRSQSIHERSGHDQNRENASASSNLAKLKDMYGDLNNQKEDAGKDGSEAA